MAFLMTNSFQHVNVKQPYILRRNLTLSNQKVMCRSLEWTAFHDTTFSKVRVWTRDLTLVSSLNAIRNTLNFHPMSNNEAAHLAHYEYSSYCATYGFLLTRQININYK